MRYLTVFIAVLFVSGCASTEIVEEQLRRLRSELSDEVKRESESVRNEYKKDLAAAQQSIQSEIANKNEITMKSLEALRETHQKDSKEINATLIDIQKDFFQNKRITEDNARRVYILESLIAATRSLPEEKAEGEILLFTGNNVTTSLGTKHGIKAGDLVGVFHDSASREKIGTVRVTVAETTQSSGELVERTGAVARGNVVRPLK